MTLPRSSRKEIKHNGISDIEKHRNFKRRVRNMKPITNTNSAMIKQMKALGQTFTTTIGSSISPNSKVFNATGGSMKPPQSMADQEISKIFGGTTRPSTSGRSPGPQTVLSSRLSQSGFSSPRSLNPFEKKKYQTLKIIFSR